MTRHLAQLNIGRLIADTDDPRVAGFMDNIERINAVGKRSPGFVWMLETPDCGAGNTGNMIDGNPRFISNLTVWEDVVALERFVWGTVHRQFYERRAEWFEALAEMHFVMWWIPAGHRPTLDEGLERLALRQAQGDTDDAFGWGHLSEATLHRSRACTPVAAE
ncbi:MAG: DUF3291 domain-containing protein [Pseudomonadota bacterium]